MTSISRELDEIQAIVRGMRSKITYTKFLYLRVDNHEHGQKFLKLMGNPTSIQDAHNALEGVQWNIAITFRGLENLGVAKNVLATFPEEFRQGMEARADDNGDTGSSNPKLWDSYWLNKGVDLWIGIYSTDRDEITAFKQAIEQKGIEASTPDAPGGEANPVSSVVIVGEQDGGRLFIGKKQVWIDDPTTQPPENAAGEHFGFSDGVTAPAIEGIWDNSNPNTNLTRVNGNGKYQDGGWLPLSAGEFVLGHVDEVYEIPIAPQPRLLSHNGTFMVLRKLYQHVDDFRDYLTKLAASANVKADYIAAKMIGRNRDGSNLIDPYRKNNFIYKDDMDGHRCPMGAHIRRANPRDTLDFESLLVNRHRIARRAFPYGDVVGKDEAEADVNPDGQGLLFIALNSSISRQFEFVLRQWINYGNDLDQGDDRDPVVGDNDASVHSNMTIPANSWSSPGGQPTITCPAIPRFVDTKGGDYFFVPSVAALTALHSGLFTEPEMKPGQANN